VASDQPREPAETEREDSPAPAEGDNSTQRRDSASELGDVSFPLSVRGYDRGAVDAYVSRVQQQVAEFELTRSPEAAIKHALEDVGEQTKGILAQAGETAERISAAARQEAEEGTARARQAADEIVAEAKATAADVLARSQAEAEAIVAQARSEAAEHLQRSRDEVGALRQEAEARMRELESDTETIQHERTQLLADIREITTRVEEVASAADARFPSPEASERAEDANLPSRAAGEAAAPEVTASDERTVDAESRPHSPG
jgi:DivIVA domain-containing protein